MNVKSILMPPNGAEKLASRLDPPEYGTARDQFLNGWRCLLVRTHRNLVFVAHLRKLGHLFCRFGVGDGDRKLIDVD